ncbi:MAG: hypothetical protein IRY99_17190 [Isosphaeraceae bacterium]|nr:hypothetical protein [Isosphaeraceae bacterium]
MTELPTQVTATNKVTLGRPTTTTTTVSMVTGGGGATTTGAFAGGGTTGVGGGAVVGGNTGGAVSLPTAGAVSKPVPTGSAISINTINAGPLGRPPLGDPQILGYDPTANALIRFDALTGAALQTIPVSGQGTPLSGVGLGRNNGRLVALVGFDQTIQAFDVATGAPVGQFSTASLAANGLTHVDGIGSNEFQTVVTDAQAGTDGLIQTIDVTASLATGQAVAVGAPFAPARGFQLNGGLTGIPGSSVFYATGGAHFDPFVPDQDQLGILGVNVTPTGTISESSRNAVPGTNTPFINIGTPAQVRSNPNRALGSIEGSLALVTGVSNGANVVTLFTPTTSSQGTTTLTRSGTVNLANPNLLTGLSESFRPELMNAALVDVQGNLIKFNAQSARGLVLNDNGTLNLVSIQSATDTAIIGRPIDHVDIPVRQNVQLLSTSRGKVGTRSGVIINRNLPAIGPLTLP